MFSPRSPLMRTKELLLEAGWRRSPQPESPGSERGFDETDDEGCFLQDERNAFAFFDNCPPEITVHIFRQLPDVRDLIAVSQVCRGWYGLVRQYNGLWQAAYLQMPTWTIRPDTRIVLERHARELAAAAAAAATQALVSTSAAATSSSSSFASAPDLPHEHHQHGSLLWHSSAHESERPSIAPLPYINLAQPPPSALCRSRGRKSWIAAHLPDLSSLALGGSSTAGGAGGLAESSSRAASHSRNQSWDLASSMRSRMLTGAAIMAQSATEQLQRRRRKSVHVDAPPTADLLENSPDVHPQSRSSTLLSWTMPSSPSPLRIQFDEEENGRRRGDRTPFSTNPSPSAKRPSSTAASRSRPTMSKRALEEHERIRSAKYASFGSAEDHFDDLDWRRLCMARWALDRRWGLPLPPRRAQQSYKPISMLRRTDSIGNEEDFNRPVSTYLKGHEDNIYCIRMDSYFFAGAGRIVSGSKDRTVKVWNRSTSQCVHTLSGHARSVLCLQYDDELLVTGSSDHTVLVWDFTFGLRKRVSLVGADNGASTMQPTVVARLQGHEDSVLNVALNEKYIVSCGKERMVRVWDRRTGDLVRIFSEHLTAVNSVSLSGNLAVSASGDSAFFIWDLENESLVRKVMSEQHEGLACVVAHGNTIATGSKPTVKVWDARTGECKQILKGHAKMVRALAYDSRRALLVSGGYDFLVLSWHVPAVDVRDSVPSPANVQSSRSQGSDSATTPSSGLGLSSFATSAVAPQSPAPLPVPPIDSQPLLLSSSASGSAPTSVGAFASTSASAHLAYQPSASVERVPDPEPLAEFRDHSGRILSLAVDGTHLVSASSDERICVRNFAVALPSDPFTSIDLEIVGGGDPDRS
ncbi:hypothetical protein A4X09_0g6146 [Tilletia walkeri]|uniref:F-box domain-containing protein n=1 Tax=Tilletia walkeri TaxID=117179 RepID=A0A8X7T2M2_9BASI|nr:hypothetical protein A4X09_0g6146 [Tilletia walkeri]